MISNRKRLALGLLALLLGAHIVLVPFRQGLLQMGTDFPNYYTAARLTLKHQPLRRYYEWVWFQRQMHYAGIDHQLGGYIPHTPLTMLPVLPLTAFQPQRAKQIWLTVELILLLGSIVLLARLSRLSLLEVTVLALLAHTALANNFLLGQYYILILFLLTCGFWCLLRKHEYLGGGIVGLIFALKLYTAPFVFYFAARRQWKALLGFAAAVATLGLSAVALFGWSDVWFFVTTVMVRGMDGSVNDPYNPGWESMTAFLRRTFMAEAELNPHPAWQAPAAFFFLRALYTLGTLALALVALAKTRRDREPHALAWFTVLLFVLSPNQASYHFILLLVPITLMLAGASMSWSLGLIALYVLAELPLFQWDAWLFPKAWIFLSLFFYAGWSFLQKIGRAAAWSTTFAVIAVAGVSTLQRLHSYSTASPQISQRVAVQPGAIYSSAPVAAAQQLLYEAIGEDRYVLRKSSAGGIQTFTFDGDAFHPAASSYGGPVFFELAGHGSSRIYSFDEAAKTLHVAIGEELQPTEPALSPDGTKIAFIARDSLNIAEGDKRTVLAAGGVSNPAFFPDGRQIAFAKGAPGRRSIIAIAISGGEVRTLVNFGDCFEPAVSPDGQTLAFTCSSAGASHVWIQDLASKVFRSLTNGFCSNASPAWESDSHSIVFASDCNRGLGLTALYRLHIQTARK